MCDNKVAESRIEIYFKFDHTVQACEKKSTPHDYVVVIEKKINENVQVGASI